VTGGAGYIGSVLVRLLLQRGHNVICLDRFYFGEESVKGVSGRIVLVRDDIRSFSQTIMDGVDCVMDLASLSNDPSSELDPKKTLEINHRGRVRVARLAKKMGVGRYILASTCSVYGASKRMSDETSPLNPLTTYAKANAMAEHDVLKLSDAKFNVTVLRQATVYGLSPKMRFDLAINGMVRSLFKEGRVKIMRDGLQWRPFVHVSDTSKAFLAAMEADPSLINGEVYNVGSDEQNYQLLPLAKSIAETLNLPFRYEWYGSTDNRNYRVRFQKIKRKLGFVPECNPKDGAREVWDALRSGSLNADDKRWITVDWYKLLLSDKEAGKEVAIRGSII
jgi:nucleoside-diphosphate-sugar epimerase